MPITPEILDDLIRRVETQASRAEILVKQLRDLEADLRRMRGY
jgi:hypothetical protein